MVTTAVPGPGQVTRYREDLLHFLQDIEIFQVKEPHPYSTGGSKYQTGKRYFPKYENIDINTIKDILDDLFQLQILHRRYV